MAKRRALIFLLSLVTLCSSVFGVACRREEAQFPSPPPVEEEAEVEEEEKRNFLSRERNAFANINGETVYVDTFYREPGEALNNPNVGQGILMYQCIRYKQAHPEEEVYLTVTSFHFSVVASVCVQEGSKHYGEMRSLYEEDYDNDGFVRMAYLAVCAAKIGIHVTAIGQLNAGAVYTEMGWRDDYDFEQYFLSYANEESELAGKKIGDFLTAKRADWTSYGDKAASDMMHVKSCSVSNYLDSEGKAGGPSVWLGSTNIDGIAGNGSNGNDGVQTGVIVSNHRKLYECVRNYTLLMSRYCEQEEITMFRDCIVRTNQAQIDLIEEGRENEIAADEQIVYLGSPQDNVFQLYFTPLGGSAGAWEPTYNPYSKYISKLSPYVSGEDYIVLAWNNVKYLTNFEYSHYVTDQLANAFTVNANKNNRIYTHLEGFDTTVFDNLVVGENVGFKKLNENMGTYFHNKDLQLSYVENGVRHYVTLFNSVNFHLGGMFYQTNTVLVVDETAATGNGVYVSLGSLSTSGCITEEDRL